MKKEINELIKELGDWHTFNNRVEAPYVNAQFNFLNEIYDEAETDEIKFKALAAIGGLCQILKLNYVYEISKNSKAMNALANLETKTKELLNKIDNLKI